MKKLLVVLLGIGILSLASCGYQSVPPGHKGKVLGVSGYSPELLGEGRHLMIGYDNIVLLDLTTNVANQNLSVTMNDTDTDGNSRAGLTMDFQTSFRYRLKADPEIVNTMFHDLKVDPQSGVTAPVVFQTYTAPLIVTVFRDVVSQFSPEEAMANRAKINEVLGKEVQKRLKGNPIEVSNVVITKMVLPPIIKKRIQTNKDRELQIAEEQAQQAIELVKRENAIILARKEAERNLIDAQAASAQNKALRNGLDDKVLRLRELEIQKIQADAVMARMSSGVAGDVVFMPYDAMSTTAGQMRIMNSK